VGAALKLMASLSGSGDASVSPQTLRSCRDWMVWWEKLQPPEKLLKPWLEKRS